MFEKKKKNIFMSIGVLSIKMLLIGIFAHQFDGMFTRYIDVAVCSVYLSYSVFVDQSDFSTP